MARLAERAPRLASLKCFWAAASETDRKAFRVFQYDEDPEAYRAAMDA